MDKEPHSYRLCPGQCNSGLPAVMEYLHYEIAYYGDDPELGIAITETVTGLPKNIWEFVIETCAFLSVGETCNGMVVAGRIGVHPRERRSRNMWLVILAENMLSDDKYSIIAHEIAHAWLKHDGVSLTVTDDCGDRLPI